MEKPEDSNVNKRALWRYVNKKIKRSIHHYHVFSVISILFQEITKDLLAGKSIKIDNFGTLFLEKLKPRKHHDFNDRKIKWSKGNHILKFKIDKSFRNKLFEYLDFKLTFKDKIE